MSKVIIIGAGPAGLFCAQKILESNRDEKIRVDIYEENAQVGIPVQCTGLLSGTIQDITSLPIEVIAHKVSAAEIISPEEKSVRIRFSSPNIVVYRDKFDQLFERLAIEQGARVQYGRKYVGKKRNSLLFKDMKTGRIQRITLQKKDVVIGADGPHSILAKSLGIYGKREFISGIQVTMKVNHNNTIRFWPHIGEYAWFVPESRDRARIGVAAQKDLKKTFEIFIKNFKGKRISLLAGPIPKYQPGIRTYLQKDGVHFYLLGDAAAQIKNTSGGGLIPGLRCAKILAQVILEGNFGEYEQRWRKEVGRELYVHYILNRMFLKFSEKDWNLLVGYFQKKELQDILRKIDRDNVKRVVPLIVLHEPRLSRFMSKLI
ncbi:MAG: NAD(P)/FAD-dependent oxidoreductase [Nanoarchaeota archaeon]